MQKRETSIWILFFLAILTFGNLPARAQDKPADPPKASASAPTLAPDKKDNILVLQKQYLQDYIQLQAIQKKYDDARNQDPDFIKFNTETNDLAKKLGDAIVDAQKGTDPTKWRLDPQSVKFVAVPPPPATPSVPPAASAK
jgi:hypothetical protein